MSEPLLSIGAFSRAASLSIKALRAYHAQGLLTPAAVDPETGFRRYAAGQLADATIIRRLRDLEVPLADVATILAARDPEVTAATLAGHADRMRERARQVEKIVDDLHAAPAASWTPPRLVDLPATNAVALTGIVRDGAYDAFLGPAFERLEQACRDGLVEVSGPASALYDAEFVDDAEQQVTAYFPVRADVAPVGTVLLRLPPVTAAVATHAGSYETLPDTYGLLGTWVAHHGTPTGQPIREAYVINDSDGVVPSAYQTDIVWPLTPREEPA
ncbi:MerR family transcriptional regulator [Nocardioides sp. NPDC057577]|uniref:MerR family transcriptional regulator n=1 Tax=Nocardioides sp. NPDC057577 TaxID=3346171 RepID=UPI0036731EF9